MKPRLILASASPRRSELLRGLGLDFEVLPSSIEEKREPGEGAEEYVARLARDKGRAIATQHPAAWVISADTVVYIDGEILEKPGDKNEARAMLRQLSDRRHVVYSGVSLQNAESGYEDANVTTTTVQFVPLREDRIAWYVETGEPMDKAGAYAVQGIGAMFIRSVEGNYTNVVGLPLSTLVEMMERAGLKLFGDTKA
jgi:septum formation protein